MPEKPLTEPLKGCARCPRLVVYRQNNQAKFPDFYNGAVPSFGSLDATLLIIGLAPGVKGANATGRPFTGDFAGDVLYGALLEAGLAEGCYDKRIDDGLTLKGVRITNAVRCVPPENKPTPAEVNACNDFLQAEIAAMPNLKNILTLGGLAHDALLRSYGLKKKHYPFGHAASYEMAIQGKAITLFSSYHTSRYNIQTRRLSYEQFLLLVKNIMKHC
jgi:uracil-DNA glycosylase family 4